MGHFIERHFIDGTFHRKTLSHFIDGTFHRQTYDRKTFHRETFQRWDIS